MNTGLNTREQKIDYLKYLCEEKNITYDRLRIVNKLIDRIFNEIRLDDLVTFCQTGRYPE